MYRLVRTVRIDTARLFKFSELELSGAWLVIGH